MSRELAPLGHELSRHWSVRMHWGRLAEVALALLGWAWLSVATGQVQDWRWLLALPLALAAEIAWETYRALHPGLPAAFEASTCARPLEGSQAHLETHQGLHP